MLEAYLPIFVLLGIALFLAIVLAILSRVIGPYRPSATKLRPYESGMDPVGDAKERYSISFYMVAMEFIVFDLEIIFIYPWAVRYKELGLGTFFAVMVFILILTLGLIYTLKKESKNFQISKSTN
ncbi:MAG: NADH-quinone oxidoreductase subunit A [Candidatus Cyclonatronum sp.]|uniref:NADH-quinone oxidoreductase subunit A n=1 Tax=Cyclonatronum sp. TaxID=3024185 RepID=UPI0025BEA065|nr:NADH-quinone oxidoreductase subunit A [Cyclonatronum sp.]MCC5933113.1 NADH-quinone oxidoreductase subunit A [Balneolales bacterium]MCH8486672.1 NADH-quinone oxidoreductase subunit A [Cyclonatronum sp.]